MREHIIIFDFNIFVILEKKSIVSYPELDFDKGDIIKLKEYFPDFVNEPFNGIIDMYNWYKFK